MGAERSSTAVVVAAEAAAGVAVVRRRLEGHVWAAKCIMTDEQWWRRDGSSQGSCPTRALALLFFFLLGWLVAFVRARLVTRVVVGAGPEGLLPVSTDRVSVSPGADEWPACQVVKQVGVRWWCHKTSADVLPSRTVF